MGTICSDKKCQYIWADEMDICTKCGAKLMTKEELEKQFNAVVTCMWGSSLFDALWDVDDSHKQRVVFAFLDDFGQVELDACIKHVDSDHSDETMPEFLKLRWG